MLDVVSLLDVVCHLLLRFANGAHRYCINNAVTSWVVLLQVSVVIEQLFRLLHDCGMPPADADLLHGGGPVVGHVLQQAQPRNTLFTGSSRVAEKIAVDMHGKVCRPGRAVLCLWFPYTCIVLVSFALQCLATLAHWS